MSDAPLVIDRTTGQPPYAQVRDHLRELIRSSQLDDQLPSERQLADRFGISYMTARRAIGELVDEGMLAREQGRGTFVRNRVPRAAAAGSIGIILPSKVRHGAANPFYAAVIQGVAEEGRRLGYRQTVIAAHAADLLHGARGGPVSAIVAVAQSVGDLPEIDEARKSVPVVAVDSSRGTALVPNIISDNRGGSRLAAEHLLQLGHRRIGYISGNLPGEVSEARRDGFLDALRAARVLHDPQLMVEGDYELESGYIGAGRLLNQARPPTAIACANDTMAFGAYRRAHEMNLRIPQDLSIVGFDDLPAASYLTPGLTTMAVPRVELGWAALQLLITMLEGGTPPSHRLLPVSIAVRRSTGPAIVNA
jgi:LacI family transcriptional regulator